MKRDPMAGLLAGTAWPTRPASAEAKEQAPVPKGQVRCCRRCDLAPKTAVLSLANTETVDVGSRVVPYVKRRCRSGKIAGIP